MMMLAVLIATCACKAVVVALSLALLAVLVAAFTVD